MEYGIQYQQDLVGTSSAVATLTTDYTDNASSVYPIGGMHSIVLYVKYTPAENNAILYVQYELGPTADRLYSLTKRKDTSDDGIIQRYEYDEKFVGTTSGTVYSERFVLDQISDKYFKVSVKETTTGSHGTIYAEMLYSGK